MSNHPKLGIYTDFYGMLYWNESLGYRAVIAAVLIYFFGLSMSLVFDVQP